MKKSHLAMIYSTILVTFQSGISDSGVNTHSTGRHRKFCALSEPSADLYFPSFYLSSEESRDKNASFWSVPVDASTISFINVFKFSLFVFA